jgi:hypothetical protein
MQTMRSSYCDEGNDYQHKCKDTGQANFDYHAFAWMLEFSWLTSSCNNGSANHFKHAREMLQGSSESEIALWRQVRCSLVFLKYCHTALSYSRLVRVRFSCQRGQSGSLGGHAET